MPYSDLETLAERKDITRVICALFRNINSKSYSFKLFSPSNKYQNIRVHRLSRFLLR